MLLITKILKYKYQSIKYMQAPIQISSSSMADIKIALLKQEVSLEDKIEELQSLISEPIEDTKNVFYQKQIDEIKAKVSIIKGNRYYPKKFDDVHNISNSRKRTINLNFIGSDLVGFNHYRWQNLQVASLASTIV